MALVTTTVMLTPEQHEWLRERPAGLSGTIRLLVEEAVRNESKKRKLTKEDLEVRLRDIQQLQLETQAALNDERNAKLVAQDRAAELERSARSNGEVEREEYRLWSEYRDAHKGELENLTLPELKALKERVIHSPPSLEGGEG